VDDDDAAAGAELEDEPDAVGLDADEAEPDAAEVFDAALGLEDELEQPARESVAATTAIAAVGRQGRYLTMTPSVSGCGHFGDDARRRQSLVRTLISF
jgi:hypothetical protein